MKTDSKYAPNTLGSVCVVGLGVTGRECANYLCDLLGTRVKSLHIFAGEKNEFSMKLADKYIAWGASVSFDDTDVVNHYNLCIVSPGISINSEITKSAMQKCDQVISEVEFAWRESPKKSNWIAVTGTNGKTTTTSLINHILTTSGKKSVAVGNIGNVALNAVKVDQCKSFYEHNEFYVVEVSSYQLALTDRFAPDVAVLLNVTPDHIEWHGNFEEYKKAKTKIFNNAKISILNTDDEVAKTIFNLMETDDNNVINVSKDIVNAGQDTNNNHILAYDNKGQLHDIIVTSKMKIFGEHNCVNARAAASACLCCGIDEDQIAKGLSTFAPLEHRLEPCGIIAGVRYVNDSKATNVDASLVAIKSFKKKAAIFLLGGKDKNTPLEQLVKSSIENLKGVVCYGASKDRFFEAFQNQLSDESDDLDTPGSHSFILKKADKMKDAFEVAKEMAFPGDFVVLSPSCASFDEFDSFEQRGNVFKDIVDTNKKDVS